MLLMSQSIHCNYSNLKRLYSISSFLFQIEQDASVSESSPHIANIGRLVEDMENKIRNTLNDIYFGKTKDILNGLRSIQPLSEKQAQNALKEDIVNALQKRQAKNDN